MGRARSRARNRAPHAIPAKSPQGARMYKHILVPTDGTPLSLKAAKTAGALAKRLKAKITTLYVITPFAMPQASEGVVYHMSYTEADYARDMRVVATKA